METVDLKLEIKLDAVDYVETAFSQGVTDIGQIPPDQLWKIKKFVECHALEVVWDYSYPLPKRRYVPAFQHWLEEYKKAHKP